MCPLCSETISALFISGVTVFFGFTPGLSPVWEKSLYEYTSSSRLLF